LLKFLESPYKILSKEELLTSVWDDVEVQEQVLFQTIRELRQVFSEHQVIQTHPRKGYAWVADVEFLENSPAEISTTARSLKSLKVMLLLIISLTLSFIVYQQSYNRSDDHSVEDFSGKLSGSLVILPVENQVKDNNHQWVHFGAMDQLISRISSDSNLVVMGTDYVLEILRDANLKHDDFSQDLSRIFEVSGASFIVETQLSGTPQQYQLKYTFHFKTSTRRGVILNQDVNSALIELVDEIVSYTGQSIRVNEKEFDTDFSNEILARALDLQDKNDHFGAVKLFEGLLQIEPNNLTARRLIAHSHMELRQLEEAERHLSFGVNVVKPTHSTELHKMHYLLSFINYIRGNLDNAVAQIALADNLATLNNDWLYRALNAQLKAKLYIQYQDYELAHQSLNKALSYHGVIQCPIGTSDTLLQLSLLANLQGKQIQSQDYFDRAKDIIAQRNLTTMQLPLKDTSNKLKHNQ